MLKTWTEDLAVGVEDIDNQHREFISALNSLLDAMSKGRGRDEMNRIFVFIEGYVEKHFNLEEEYMRRFMYPKYNAHKAIHDGFKKEMADIKSEYAEKGVAIKLVLKVERNMLDWFLKHIKQVDKKLGAFLRDKV